MNESTTTTKDLTQCVSPDPSPNAPVILRCRKQIKTMAEMQKLAKACWNGVPHGSDNQEQRRQDFIKVYPGDRPTQWSNHRRAGHLSAHHDVLNLLRGKPLCHGTGDVHLVEVKKLADFMKSTDTYGSKEPICPASVPSSNTSSCTISTTRNTKPTGAI
jgi:hypothetical protein